MKICIISDSHDRSEPLAAAISAAHAAGAEAVIHCGDLIGANTLRASLKIGLPIHVAQGNNLGDPQAIHNLMKKSPGSFFFTAWMRHWNLVDEKFSSRITRITITAWPAPGTTT